MATNKLLVLGAAILLFGIIAETSGQYRNGGFGGYGGYGGFGRNSHPYFQQRGPGYGEYQQPGYQQPGYQQPGYQQQLPSGVSVQEAEWVCKNPKTGDMMIISSEEVPSTGTAGNGNQQGNYPQPPFVQPTFPQPTPTYPTQNPQQPSTGEPNTNGDGMIDIRMRE